MSEQSKNRWKTALFSGVFLVVTMALPAVFGQAQSLGPPVLPAAPSQSPIGGAAIFAALGGAYAAKKLWWDCRKR